MKMHKLLSVGPRLGALVCAVAMSLNVAQAGVMVPIPGDPISTDTGRISGTRLDSGFHAYLGIPYAEPPVRGLRWRPPAPVKPWKGILNADATRPACVQPLRSTNVVNEFPPATTLAEDCLYMNVWTPPTAKAGAKLPVIVYIHGGGFRDGGPSTPDVAESALVRKGVVYVTLGYRLGIFGYLAHPEMTKESSHNASGNWGMLDQIEGLQWVKRNIAAFGGDPANVTIMGESAGSESVHFLQSSPLAHGLFAKLSGWSGAAFPPGGQAPATLQQAEADGLKFQSALKANSLAEMRGLSWEAVYSASVQTGVRTRPIVDGYSIPELPVNIFQSGKQNDVPIYVSSTAKDLGSNAQFYTVKTLAELRELAKQTFGADVDDFLKLFPASNDAEAVQQARAVLAGGGFGVVNRDWARAQATSGKQPAYLAQWAHVHPYTPGVKWTRMNPEMQGANHAGDIIYWLGTYEIENRFTTTRNFTAWDRELSEKMQSTLVAFAKTGNPATDDVKVPRYDPNNEQRIVFGDKIYVEKMNTAQIEFLRAHPPGRGQQGGRPPGGPGAPGAN